MSMFFFSGPHLQNLVNVQVESEEEEKPGQWTL